MATIERRIGALEAAGAGASPPLLIVRYIVAFEGLDAEPAGIHAAPPHFPAPVDRLPGEGWPAFTARLQGRLSHLPHGSVVRVVSRDAPA